MSVCVFMYNFHCTCVVYYFFCINDFAVKNTLCGEQFNAVTDTYGMCGIEKKVVAADEKLTLNDVLRQEFSVDKSAASVLQSWDAEFED